ncbi:unnamed protein product, partial [Echinostoma caproni]|uniref:Rod_C domain-containing protein n=1 Tax=Echinostoma caproni TaxID=27848 RepID=A0A183B1H9_9TREM
MSMPNQGSRVGYPDGLLKVGIVTPKVLFDYSLLGSARLLAELIERCCLRRNPNGCDHIIIIKSSEMIPIGCCFEYRDDTILVSNCFTHDNHEMLQQFFAQFVKTLTTVYPEYEILHGSGVVNLRLEVFCEYLVSSLPDSVFEALTEENGDRTTVLFENSSQPPAATYNSRWMFVEEEAMFHINLSVFSIDRGAGALCDRKRCLSQILFQPHSHNSAIISYLESVIRIDTNLAPHAFNILSLILPTNYTENSYILVDTAQLAEQLEHSSVPVSDIALFLSKDLRANLEPFVCLLLDRLQFNQDDHTDVLNLLSELVEDPHGKEHVAHRLEDLIGVAVRTDRASIRQRLVDIAQQVDPIDWLNGNDQSLILMQAQEIHGTLSGHHVVDFIEFWKHHCDDISLTDHEVDLCSKILGDTANQQYFEEIGNLLLISNFRRKPGINLLPIVNVVKHNIELMRYPGIVDLLLYDATGGLIDCENFPDETRSDLYLLVNDATLSLQHRVNISKLIITMFGESLIYKYPISQIPFSIESLDLPRLLLVTCADKICESCDSTAEGAIAFLLQYYAKINQDVSIMKQLYKFRAGGTPKADVYLMLNALCLTKSLGLQVNLDDAEDTIQNDYLYRLLFSVMLKLYSRDRNLEEEAELASLLDGLQRSFDENENSSRRRVEIVMQLFISDSETFVEDLCFVNEVLYLLRTSPLALNRFFRKDFRVCKDESQLHVAKLQDILHSKQIKCTKEAVEQLNQFRRFYQRNIFYDILEQVEPGTSLDELLNFFTQLDSSEMDCTDRELFLASIPDNTGPSFWTPLLHEKMLHIYMTSGFNDRTDQTERVDDERAGANAYNEANNTNYCYTIKDIDVIAQSWMAEFQNGFIISPAVTIEEFFDRHLSEVNRRYKVDRQTTIVPVSTSSKQWILIAFHPQTDRNMVLYLDTRDPFQFSDDQTKMKELLQKSCSYATIREYFFPNGIRVPDSGPYVLLLDDETEELEVAQIVISCRFPPNEMFLSDSVDYDYVFRSVEFDFLVVQDITRRILQLFVNCAQPTVSSNEIIMNATDLRSLNVTAETPEPAITLSSLQHRNILEQLGVSNCQEENEKLYVHFNLAPEKMIRIEQTPLLKTAQMNVILEKSRLLFAAGWHHDSIRMALRNVNSTTRLSQLLCAFDIIADFRLREFDTDVALSNLLEQLAYVDTKTLQQRVHQLAIRCTFPEAQDKSRSKLCSELVTTNAHQNISYLNDSDVEMELEKVWDEYKNVHKWTKSQIREWANDVRTKESPVPLHLHTLIAVLMRGVQLTHGYTPRDAQLLALLCLLNARSDRGRLLQVDTGEGKTVTIAMF